jgi:hypothetical protein
MAQLLMQWMNLAQKHDPNCPEQVCAGPTPPCEETALKGQAETMRHVLMQMNQMRHF